MPRRFAALLAFALVLPAGLAPAADPEIVAVAACDPYDDVKRQLRWFGGLIEQPTLDILAESFLMPITNFKGLKGLDRTRPIGLVMTADGADPVTHVYVPVTDLDKLLDAFQGITGPVEDDNGVRRISPPGGGPMDVVEKGGWAIFGPRDARPPVADPGKLFAGVLDRFTLGVEAFPSRMPDEMVRNVETMLRQATAAAGPQDGEAGATDLVANLAEMESLLMGVAIDTDAERVFLESRTRMKADSPTVAELADMAKGVVTVASPATGDGKAPAVSAHLAVAIPETLRPGATAGLAALQAGEGADAATETAMAVLREALAAMIEAGGCDAALSVDTSVAATDGDAPLPDVTLGMRVQDGPALEARIKSLITDAGEIPGLKADFDTGKAAGANLHTLTFTSPDAAGGPDLDVEVTLAVAPNYVFILAGQDVPGRLATISGASGKPDALVEPLADVQVALGPMLRYAAVLARFQNDGTGDPDGMEAAADVADRQNSAAVRLLARPIERGMSFELSADAGAIRTVAASTKPKRGAAPAGPVPGPLPPNRPVPVPPPAPAAVAP